MRTKKGIWDKTAGEAYAPLPDHNEAGIHTGPINVKIIQAHVPDHA